MAAGDHQLSLPIENMPTVQAQEPSALWNAAYLAGGESNRKGQTIPNIQPAGWLEDRLNQFTAFLSSRRCDAHALPIRQPAEMVDRSALRTIFS